MTKEEIFEEVIAKVKANEELTKKFIMAFNEGNLAAVVKEMGYDFPVEELIAYIDEKEENMDLSEMANVAGGFKCEYYDPPCNCNYRALCETYNSCFKEACTSQFACRDLI